MGIMKTSKDLGLISDNDYDEWDGIIYLRNCLVHNNGVADKDSTLKIGTISVNCKKDKMNKHIKAIFLILLLIVSCSPNKTESSSTNVETKKDSDEISNKVKMIISDQLGQKVNLNDSLVKKLGADELDIVELVMRLEEEFDISIPDESIGGEENSNKMVSNSLTANDLIQIIKRLKTN